MFTMVLEVYILLLVVLAVWLTARRYYLSPLRRLLAEIRNVRYGDRDQISDKYYLSLAGYLAHEFKLLTMALTQAQNDLERTRTVTESQVLDRTRNLYGMLRQLEKTAQTDDLTGLVNRASFNNHLTALFKQAKSSNSDLTCLMIDIDNFKFVNDSVGHVVGDDVLNFVGTLLKACIRPGDIAARYGGDEFVLLLPMCSHKQARKIAERIRILFKREVEKFTPAALREQPDLSLGLSIGLAGIRRDNPKSAQQLLEFADQALYRAKKTGRNTVTVR
jgi:diguanylate cyclase (GGDEF)-like protein